MKKVVTIAIIAVTPLLSAACMTEEALDRAEEKSSQQLDNYYREAEKCDIQSSSYLRCVNNAADRELDYFGEK